MRDVTGFEAGTLVGGLIEEDNEEVDTRFVNRGTPLLEGFGIAAGAGCDDVDVVCGGCGGGGIPCAILGFGSLEEGRGSAECLPG